MTQIAELRVSYQYAQEHPWIIQGITGFLSAYYMEYPGFQVKKHFDEQESGMHIWVCEIPSDMNMMVLLRRLRHDIPPCRYTQVDTESSLSPHYVIMSPDEMLN